MTLLLSLLLFVSAPADEILLEAEEAELFGVQVATERTGFSGTGYVTGFTAGEDSLRFTFETEGGGVFELLLGVAVSGRTTNALVRIDGVEQQKLILGTGQSFGERLLGEGRIGPGTHTVVVSGNFDVDYLRVAPIQEPGPTPPPEQLTDPLATPATRALHRFLLTQYGQHILAGQQNLNEIQYVRTSPGASRPWADST
ncbi:MAG TPA: CBM35 domain-containing protein [Rhodothermales bacterium]